MKTKNVAIDIDGTLIEYNGWVSPDHFGELLPGAKDLLEILDKNGYRIILFTTRTNPEANIGYKTVQLREKIRKWTAKVGINQYISSIYIGRGKPLAELYVDDRAVHHETNKNWTAKNIVQIMERLAD